MIVFPINKLRLFVFCKLVATKTLLPTARIIKQLNIVFFLLPTILRRNCVR